MDNAVTKRENEEEHLKAIMESPRNKLSPKSIDKKTPNGKNTKIHKRPSRNRVSFN